MANVTETRDSGVELLDADVELAEGVEGTLFRTEDEVEIQVGESAGHPVTVTAQHFIAASIDQELDEDDPMRAMTGETEINESSVFVSNEDGEPGAGVLQVDEGDVEDALTEFEDSHLTASSEEAEQ